MSAEGIDYDFHFHNQPRPFTELNEVQEYTGQEQLYIKGYASLECKYGGPIQQFDKPVLKTGSLSYHLKLASLKPPTHTQASGIKVPAVDTSTSPPDAAAETALRDGFEKAVAEVALSEALVLSEGRTKPPKSLARYGLVAIRATSRQHRTITPAGSHVSVPPDVNCHYKHPGHRPYLDAGLAIGLTYDDTLQAIAAGGVEAKHIRVRQLQAVGPPTSSPTARYRNGLHGGFSWRPTLVRVWQEVGRQVGIDTVSIQSTRNNPWTLINGQNPAYPANFAAYDGVAETLGYMQDAKGNWFPADYIADQHSA